MRIFRGCQATSPHHHAPHPIIRHHNFSSQTPFDTTKKREESSPLDSAFGAESQPFFSSLPYGNMPNSERREIRMVHVTPSKWDFLQLQRPISIQPPQTEIKQILRITAALNYTKLFFSKFRGRYSYRGRTWAVDWLRRNPKSILLSNVFENNWARIPANVNNYHLSSCAVINRLA